MRRKKRRREEGCSLAKQGPSSVPRCSQGALSVHHSLWPAARQDLAESFLSPSSQGPVLPHLANNNESPQRTSHVTDYCQRAARAWLQGWGVALTPLRPRPWSVETAHVAYRESAAMRGLQGEPELFMPPRITQGAGLGTGRFSPQHGCLCEVGRCPCVSRSGGVKTSPSVHEQPRHSPAMRRTLMPVLRPREDHPSVPVLLQCGGAGDLKPRTLSRVSRSAGVRRDQ